MHAGNRVERINCISRFVLAKMSEIDFVFQPNGNAYVVGNETVFRFSCVICHSRNLSRPHSTLKLVDHIDIVRKRLKKSR